MNSFTNIPEKFLLLKLKASSDIVDKMVKNNVDMSKLQSLYIFNDFVESFEIIQGKGPTGIGFVLYDSKYLGSGLYHEFKKKDLDIIEIENHYVLFNKFADMIIKTEYEVTEVINFINKSVSELSSSRYSFKLGLLSYILHRLFSFEEDCENIYYVDKVKKYSTVKSPDTIYSVLTKVLEIETLATVLNCPRLSEQIKHITHYLATVALTTDLSIERNKIISSQKYNLFEFNHLISARGDKGFDIFNLLSGGKENYADGRTRSIIETFFNRHEQLNKDLAFITKHSPNF